MSLTEIKKLPLISIPYIKKRLRRITALGLRNLTVNELNFTVHFTLHRNDKTVAFYTSEPVENQRSPEWSHLQFPTNVQILQEFVMRLWITSSNTCCLFLEYDIHLNDSLMPDEQKNDSHRSNNSLWIEMFGHRFTDDESLLNNNTKKIVQLIDIRTNSLSEKKSKKNHFVKSYNNSSINRMITVIEAIRTHNRLSIECLNRLQTLADENEDYLSKIKERESRRIRIEHLKQHFLYQVSNYQRRLNSNQDRQKLINEKKNRLDQNLLQLLNQQKELNLLINQLNQSKYLLQDLIHLTHFRQKYIISEIYHYVYPIIAENKTEFSIRNILLPPAEDKSYLVPFSRERDYEIEAAIGFCAHFVLIISQFIHLPLRYPISFYGISSIRIYDYSQEKPDYSLCPRYDLKSFEYGFYLLNRDIGQIMSHCRVDNRRTDYRKTLQNLKALMEQYFININDKPHNQNGLTIIVSLGVFICTHSSLIIQLFALNQQLTESTNLSNSIYSSSTNMNDRSFIRNKRNSTANCVFSPTRSEISSVIEMNDHEDDTHEVDLFPTLNTIPPRLTMQYSQPK